MGSPGKPQGYPCQFLASRPREPTTPGRSTDSFKELSMNIQTTPSLSTHFDNLQPLPTVRDQHHSTSPFSNITYHFWKSVTILATNRAFSTPGAHIQRTLAIPDFFGTSNTCFRQKITHFRPFLGCFGGLSCRFRVSDAFFIK